MDNNRAPLYWISRIAGKLDGLVRRGGVRECDYAGLAKGDPVYWLRKIFDRLGYVESITLVPHVTPSELELRSSESEPRLFSIEDVLALVRAGNREETFRLADPESDCADLVSQEFRLKIWSETRYITRIVVSHWSFGQTSPSTPELVLTFFLNGTEFAAIESSEKVNSLEIDLITVNAGDELTVVCSGVPESLGGVEGLDVSIFHQ